MDQYTIITHLDGDGICAGALCIQGLQQRSIPSKDIFIKFTQPYRLNHLLDSVINEQDVSNIHVYVLDLASRPGVLPLLRQFKSATYIDHHIASLELENHGIDGLIDQYRSCSQLVVDYFGMSHSRLVTLGSACDKMLILRKADPMWREAELLRTALIFNATYSRFRYNLVYKLANGKMPSDIEEVKDYSSMNNQRIAFFSELISNNILIDNDQCIITHTGTENARGYAGIIATKLAVSNVKPVFVLFRDDRDGVVVITSRCHRDNTLDLSRIMNKFSGGGHRMAAGGVMVGDYTYDGVAVKILEAVNNQAGV